MKKQLILLYILFMFSSCEKQDKWLDAKSNKSDVIPTSVKDFQAILDNTNIMNSAFPALGLLSADNIMLTDAVAQTSGNVSERNAYKWAPDIYEGLNGPFGTNDWIGPYKMVEYSNIVLDGLRKLPPNDQGNQEYKNVQGSALFYRGVAFFLVAQLYAKPYQRPSASADLGIPIKLSADVNEKVGRGSLQQTYDQIISDIVQSIPLLPMQAQFKSRPCRAAAYAMLAKVYLNMEEYDLALTNAEEALKLNGSLLNLTSISPAPTYPFPTYQNGNPEITFYAIAISFSSTTLTNLLVDEGLYSTYSPNDLRRTLYYRINTNGTKSFRGRYSGASTNFAGIANNEIFLIKAECQARAGSISDSMDTINLLLVTRYASGSYTPYTANNETDALRIILTERRKELPFTGNTRWEDLRRLNHDPRFAKTLTRVIAGQTYTLPPNDQRYTLPIIPAEIQLNGLVQNPR